MTSYYDSKYNEMKNHAVGTFPKYNRKCVGTEANSCSDPITFHCLFGEGGVGQTYHFDSDLVMLKCNKPKIDQHLILYFYFNSVFVL